MSSLSQTLCAACSVSNRLPLLPDGHLVPSELPRLFSSFSDATYPLSQPASPPVLNPPPTHPQRSPTPELPRPTIGEFLSAFIPLSVTATPADRLLTPNLA